MHKRITKIQREIADRHIAAKANGTFDVADFRTSEEMIDGLRQGKVYHELLTEIEVRFVPVTSILVSTLGNYQTDTYTRNVRKAFRDMLSKWGIQ